VVTILILSPYRAQCEVLNGRLQLEAVDGVEVRVSTVNAVQGREADIVIYTTVRTQGDIDFVADQHQLNVAISRARELFVIVGSAWFLSNASPDLFEDILEYCENDSGGTHIHRAQFIDRYRLELA
jgi:superfamily I DNA and/or RNA helicase